MARLSADADSTSKLPLGEKRWIYLTWAMPDLYLLEKLKLISRVPEEVTDEDDDDGDSSIASEEVAEEIASTTSLAAPELDVALWSTLSDDLLQSVIARLPLVSLLSAASSLSKEWRLRVCSVSFQDEVNWSLIASKSSFCPLFMTENKKVLLGCESRSREWFRLPSLSYLPENIQKYFDWDLIGASGSLLCVAGARSNSPVVVTNPMTRSWRQLPPCPADERYSVQIVCGRGSKPYKVFINSYRETSINSYPVMWIFDSIHDSWMEVSSLDGSSVIINGVLHKLISDYRHYPVSGAETSVLCYGRNSFDLKEKVWKGASCLYQIFPESPGKPPKAFTPTSGFGGFTKLFVCGSKVILVVTDAMQISSDNSDNYSGSDRDSDSDSSDSDDDNDENPTLTVYELDFDSGWAFELSRAPVELLNRIRWVGQAVFDGDCCIYMGETFPSILFNVKTLEWVWVHLGEGMPRNVYDWETGRSVSSYFGKGVPKSDAQLSEHYVASWWRWAPITYKPGLMEP